MNDFGNMSTVGMLPESHMYIQQLTLYNRREERRGCCSNHTYTVYIQRITSSLAVGQVLCKSRYRISFRTRCSRVGSEDVQGVYVGNSVPDQLVNLAVICRNSLEGDGDELL